MSVPGQLNFSDLALGFAPPLVLAASLAPLLEQSFGCISHIESSGTFRLLQEMRAVPALGLLAVAVVILYVVGQLLLSLSDMFRYRSIPFLCHRGRFKPRVAWAFKWLPDLNTPYERFMEQCPTPIKSVFLKNLHALNPDLAKDGVKPRSQIWAAAGFLQQHGVFTVPERFNTLAIFMFSVGLWIVFAGALTLIAQVFLLGLPQMVIGVALCFFGIVAIARHTEFYRFFASSVTSSFNAHFAKAVV